MPSESYARPIYEGGGDPALAKYYPKWVDNLAPDVTLEGTLLNGVLHGPEAVKTVVVTIRSLYETQAHRFAGPYGENGFLEDYVARLRGEPIGCVLVLTRNPAGQAQRIVVGYRPLSSVMLLSRLVREKLAGRPYAEQFLAGKP
jgi:hypothetical protein